MSQHIDIEAYERMIREQAAASRQASLERVAAGNAEPNFADAQYGFDETEVQFSLADARLTNACIPDHIIASAAGIALGRMVATFIHDRPADDVADFFRWFSQSISDVQQVLAGDHEVEGAAVAELVFAPTIEGGHA